MAEITVSAALASAEEAWRDGHGTINEDVAQVLAAEVRRLQAAIQGLVLKLKQEMGPNMDDYWGDEYQAALKYAVTLVESL